MRLNKMTLLTPEEVAAKLGLSRRAFPQLRYRDETFPDPIKLSEKVWRWYEEDIDKWVATKKEISDGKSERTG
jgi:predicted DNA-binding transcriptional regulator AlpA